MILPPELFQLIIQHVATRADLHRLLFVSRIIFYEAESALYHTIEITDRMPLSMGLLCHLARCHRVACYVKELSICGPITLTSLNEAQTPSPDHYWHILNQALCALKNLRVLTLSTYIVSPRNPQAITLTSRIFSNCPFKLEVLRIEHYVEGSLPHLDLSLVKELRLGGMSSTITNNRLSIDALPSLRILSSLHPQLLELGADNNFPIKALELLSSGDLPFGKEFPNITSLKLPFMPDRWIQSFPSLRYLSAHMGQIDRLSVLVDKLSILKNLEKLCLINAKGIVYPFDLHVKLFSVISSLQELVIAQRLGIRGMFKEPWGLPRERQAAHWNRNDKNHRNVLEDMSEWKDTRWLQ